MCKYICKIMFVLIIISLFNSNLAKAQYAPMLRNSNNNSNNTNLNPLPSIVKYPVFTINPQFNIIFPDGVLANTYKPGFGGGLQFALRINKETSFYLQGVYLTLPVKSDVQGPDASIIAITLGPRYTFRSDEIKARLILEAGAGIKIYTIKDYTTTGTPSVTIPGKTTVYFGVDAGPGALIPLGKNVDLLIKAKIHGMFTPDGTQTFISPSLGIDIKF